MLHTPSNVGLSLEATLDICDSFALCTSGIGMKFSSDEESNPQSNMRVTLLKLKIKHGRLGLSHREC